MFTADEYAQLGDSVEHRWKCLECGREFKTFRNETWYKEGAVKAYAQCTSCHPVNEQVGSSSAEKQLFEFVHSIEPSAFNYQLQSKHIIPPYELDIYAPAKKLAVEYDGLYWHSDAAGVTSAYHLMKTQLCEQQGIRLVHVFENEWLQKQDIVKSRLKDLLGIYD